MRRWLLQPSLADLVFVVWALVVALGFHHRLLNGDGDPGWHLRLGGWMLDHRQVLLRHTFSHTAYGRPFVPMEWGSQVLLAGAERLGGLAGVVVLAALILATTFTLLLVHLQRRGVDPLLAYLTVTLAAVLSGAHWIARPHLLTFLCTAALVALADGPRERSAWLLVPLFAAWANLHGGVLFGLGLLGVLAAADTFDAWRRGAGAGARLRRGAAALAAALAGTALNPVGPRLLWEELAFLSEGSLPAASQEFTPPDFRSTTGAIFLATAILVVGVAVLRRRRVRTRTWLVLAALTVLALAARRNIALYGLTVLPFLAVDLDPDWRAIPTRLLAHARTAFAADDARAARGPWSAVVACGLLVLALLHGRVAGRAVVPDGFDPAVMPVAAVEHARAAGVRGTLFNHFDWGGYVQYAWPEERVFIDGATNFYGVDVVRDYMRIAGLHGGWHETLDRYGIDVVLVPADSRLARALGRDASWSLAYDDATAVLLVRRGTAADRRTAARRPG
ncbi:MAG: hypothetical protein IRZ00_08420 [Gemmatimonadetes bacterium]|nr:hypothetical protein [Gemmatimonadota bacterium]